MHIVPLAYQYCTISCISRVYHSHCFDRLSIVSVDILFDHYNVLWLYIYIYSLEYTLQCPLIVGNNTHTNPFGIYRCSSSRPCLLNRLLWPSTWMLAAFPHSRWCTNQWMFLYQLAYLDYNLYHAVYSGHMHQDWKIVQREEECVNTHLLVAYYWFGAFELPHCHWVAQVVFWVEIASVVVKAIYVGQAEVHACLCTSSMSTDLFQCHLSRRPSVRLVIKIHSEVCLYRNVHMFMLRTLNSQFRLFSDLGARFLD